MLNPLATEPVSKLSPTAPKAQNAIAWAIGPGGAGRFPSAESAKFDSNARAWCSPFPWPTRHCALSALSDSLARSPRALPWAIAFRAFGAGIRVFTQALPTAVSVALVFEALRPPTHPFCANDPFVQTTQRRSVKTAFYYPAKLLPARR